MMPGDGFFIENDSLIHLGTLLGEVAGKLNASASRIAALQGWIGSRGWGGAAAAAPGELGSARSHLAKAHQELTRAQKEVVRRWHKLGSILPSSGPDDEEEKGGGLFSGIGHFVLDGVGLIPVVGEPADLANAAWYESEGDHFNAAASAASAIPFLGWGGTAAKWGKRAVEGGEALNDARKGAKIVNEASKASKIEYKIGNPKKIEGDMRKRGWSHDNIDEALNNPSRTAETRDTRNRSDGTQEDDPATAYYLPDGSGYVVRNDRTGDIVQVSKRNNPSWKAPWDQPQ